MPRTLRIGTRGSRLALAQSGAVAAALRAASPDFAYELVVVQTEGDLKRDSLRAIGGRGVFASAIEAELLAGRVDLAVHSLKDLTTTETPGLSLAAVPAREDVRDVLIAGRPWSELPQGAQIGTGSLRRAAQLRLLRPDLQVRDLRGNVDSRIARVRSGELDGVVLAAAGLKRLGRAAEIAHVFPEEAVLPMVGQGALAIQARTDDAAARGAVRPLEDAPTRAAVTAERAFLRRLGAGCTAPVAAYA
ncbi:MAG TPA: hydroxymethylbilane synthase, partial [Limnochordia bacterium]|nr:hydroxymethylbilane synthase [Limnochordia bacterium]